MYVFHPWGQINWLLNIIKKGNWSILGCISPEERCLGTLECFLNNHENISSNFFLNIKDPPSDYSKIIKENIVKRVELYDNLIPLSKRNINGIDLLAPTYEIVKKFEDFMSISSEDVILDISSLPKRFFFAFVKLLLKDDRIRNLVVTYTTAKQYDSGNIADDPEPWYHLPLFGPIDYPEKKPKHAIVGIGFIPFGLSNLIKGKYQETPVVFFFPFPPGPPHIHRSWEFLRLIEKSYNLKKEDKILRINSIDTSDAFNHIKAISNNGLDDIILAPYGPKPISLAFSIYASLSGSPVYYTQPKKYSPTYCLGIDNVFGYCIKNDGKILYQIGQ